jgi:hypothetical protein
VPRRLVRQNRGDNQKQGQNENSLDWRRTRYLKSATAFVIGYFAMVPPKNAVQFSSFFKYASSPWYPVSRFLLPCFTGDLDIEKVTKLLLAINA